MAEDFDLHHGVGINPMIRPSPLGPNYDGTFDSYKDARQAADTEQRSGRIDWWLILQGDNHFASWSSGLTGPRQRNGPNIQNIPIRTPEGAAIRKAAVKHLYGTKS